VNPGRIPTRPHHRRPFMNTRTIAVIALVIAVVVLILLLM
jgi:hypothetical protein